jgi:hypothetical protein
MQLFQKPIDMKHGTPPSELSEIINKVKRKEVITFVPSTSKVKGKAIPLQTLTGPEGS